MMLTNACVVFVLVAAVIGTVLQAQIAPGAAPFNGRLYAVALNGAPARTLKAADANLVAPSLRPRFQRFLRCQTVFRSRLPKPNGFFAEAAFPKEQNVERGITCLIEAPGIADTAADYVAHARILYEWEGLSSSPLEESAYAERYIDEHADSPLKPYLCLFIAQRARYAFEFLADDKNPLAMTSVAAQYRSFLARARQADPLIALVADDLDGLAFVYRDVGRHPKNF